jgi:hypothetical protein
MAELKFIIVKDRQSNKLKHYFSDWLCHDTIARDNNYDYREVIEAGMIIDNKIIILDCIDKKHKDKHYKNVFDNRIEFYSQLWIKARQVESSYLYNKNITGLKEGD